ncbi:MAG: hypothetical protein ACP5R0_02950 [Thermoplasmata archaeon]
MNCGKILSTWNQGYMYYTEILFTIVFFIFGIIIAIFSIFSLFGLVFALIFIIIGIFSGFIDISKGTPGRNTISARLNEFCYAGYSRPFGNARVKIDFNEKPRLIVLRYAYFFSPPGTFMSLTSPWQGWNLLFIHDGKVSWGPDVSTVNYLRRDHVFMGSVIKRFRELNFEVEYALLDPQYMDDFVDSLKKYAGENLSLKEILNVIGLDEYGRLKEKHGKIYEPPEDLERASINITYEEMLPAILSR